MSMRGARKDPVFTTSKMGFSLPAAGITVATGGLVSSVDPSTLFEARVGRSLRNATVARIWVRGLVFHNVTVTTVTEYGFFVGAIVLTENVEDVDFPEISLHAGDWMLHDARVLRDTTGTVPQLQIPSGVYKTGSSFDIDNRSKRLIRRDTDKLFIVVAKDVATEEPILADLRVTVMWLVP